MGDSAIHALAGAVGGGAAMALTYPLVNISTRAAVSKNKDNKGFVAEIARTLKTEGVAGLYAGLGSSLLGIAVTNATYYVRRSRRRRSSRRRRGRGRSGFGWEMVCRDFR
jgi:adenine nucleotide transporter 17